MSKLSIARDHRLYRTLVLNADYRPLSTYPLSLVSARDDALSTVLRNRAEVVETWDDAFFHSPSVAIPVPKVIALRHFVQVYSSPKFCRYSVFLRDRFCCFAAGTRVLMADGRQIEIEHVKIGNRVIDAFGSPVTVVNTGKRIADNCVMIKHRGSFEHTVVTDDHPYLAENGEFVAIKEFHIGERKGGGRTGGYLRVPRVPAYELPPAETIDLTKLLPPGVWFRARDGRIYRSRHKTASGMPATVRQSADLAYLMGLFVAEGSTTSQGHIVFSFCDDEEHTLAADTSRLLAEVFGMRSWTNVSQERHTCIVGCSSKTLAEIISNQCGKGARNKKTPWHLIGPYHMDYLRGLFQGDAHFDHSRQKIALSMIGFDAVFGAQSMLWGLSIHPTIQHLELPGKQPILTLILNAENRSKFMKDVMRIEVEDGEFIFGDKTHVYRRLQDRIPIEGDIIVYNIETDGSHSYVANGISVHNCQYCGQRFDTSDLTFDHVLPREHGGRTTWDNILSACEPCNTEKRNRLPNYSGRRGRDPLRPLKQPRAPTAAELLRAGLELVDPVVLQDWGSFLYWSAELRA